MTAALIGLSPPIEVSDVFDVVTAIRIRRWEALSCPNSTCEHAMLSP
jgi:hypothetical protein